MALPTRVVRGDVIRAELINEILDALSGLGGAARALDFNVVGGTSFLPKEVITLGSPDFATPADLNIVTLNGQYLPLLNTETLASGLLQVLVPADFPAPSSAVVAVDAPGRRGARVIRIAREQLDGDVKLEYADAPALELGAGVANFGFRVRATLRQESQITVQASFDEQAWKATVLGLPQGLLPAGSHDLYFQVQVTVPATSASRANLTVSARENGSSQPPAQIELLLERGKPAPGTNELIPIGVVSIVDDPSMSIDRATGDLLINADELLSFDFRLKFKQAGRYVLSVAADAPWTVRLGVAPDGSSILSDVLVVSEGTVSSPDGLRKSCTIGAPAGTSPTKVRFVVAPETGSSRGAFALNARLKA